MPEDDESQTTLDKPDSDSAPEQDNELLSDLPEDPAERAKALEERVVAQARDAKALRQETERLIRRVDEERGRGDHWFNEAKNRTDAPAAGQPGKTEAPPKKREKVDLAEFVGDEEEGFDKLATTLKDRYGLMSREEYNAERAAERTAQQRGAAIQNQLSEDYPQLDEPKSPLRKEAVTQFEQLEREHPQWDTEAIAELAVTRAARKVGVIAGKKSGDDGGDRANRAFGPDSRRGHGGGKVTVDDRLRTMATRTAGEALPDDVLQRVAKTVQQNQADSRRARG